MLEEAISVVPVIAAQKVGVCGGVRCWGSRPRWAGRPSTSSRQRVSVLREDAGG